MYIFYFKTVFESKTPESLIRYIKGLYDNVQKNRTLIPSYEQRIKDIGLEKDIFDMKWDDVEERIKKTEFYLNLLG